MSNKKVPPPSPRQLVQMLRIHMWADETDDDSRWFLEKAADALEASLDRNLTLSKKLEVSQ